MCTKTVKPCLLDNHLKKKKSYWFELIIISLTLAIHGYAAFSDLHNFPNIWFTRDDAYYYFKVAQNISEGLGSTFDGINLTNGYHPLWMLICIPIFALARFDLILPLRVLLLVLACMRATTAILLYHLLKKHLSLPIAMLAAIYWAFSYRYHGLIYQQGLETGIGFLCLFWFLTLLQRFDEDRKITPVKPARIAILGFAAALVLLSRLDLVFLAGFFGLWIVFRDTTLRYLLPFDMLIISASVPAAFILRVGLPEYYLYSSAAIAAIALNLATKIPAMYFFGLYNHPADIKPIKLFRNVLLVNLIGDGITLALLFGLNAAGTFIEGFPRSALIINSLLSSTLILLSRYGILLFGRRNKKQPLVPVDQFRSNWHDWLTNGLAFFLPLTGILGLYSLWNKITFGTATPVSGQIKRWWGSFTSKVYGGSARSPLEFFGITGNGDFNTWYPITNELEKWNSSIERRLIRMGYDESYILILLLFLLIVSIILFIKRKRTARVSLNLAFIPLFAGSGIQALSYNLTGYSAMKEWYWISQQILIVYIAALLLDILLRPLQKKTVGLYAVWLFVMLTGSTIITNMGVNTFENMQYGRTDPNEPFMKIVAFVEKYTPPGSIIGMTGGGNVGYYISGDRTIINMDGLINSDDYFRAHKQGSGGKYLADIGLEYIFANPNFLEAQPYRGQYTNQVEIIDYFGGKAIMKFLPSNNPTQ